MIPNDFVLRPVAPITLRGRGKPGERPAYRASDERVCYKVGRRLLARRGEHGRRGGELQADGQPAAAEAGRDREVGAVGGGDRRDDRQAEPQAVIPAGSGAGTVRVARLAAPLER